MPGNFLSIDESTSEFLVGSCRVEPRELRLTRDDGVVRLEPRVLRVLICLARRGGRTVTRDELLAEAWNGQIVSDDAINRAIWKLRAALAGDRSVSNVLETVPRKGYRLLLPVVIATPFPVPDADPPGHLPNTNLESIAAIAASAVDVADNARARGKAQASAARGVPARFIWMAGLACLGAAALAAVEIIGRARLNEHPSSEIHLKAFTTLPLAEYDPSFSPDGRRVVFAADGMKGSQLWIQAVDSATATPLTDTTGDDQAPTWSPTSESIAFVREIDRTCSLQLIAASGGAPRTIGQCQHGSWPRLSFSPDGSALVITDRPGAAEPQALVIVDLQSGNRRSLTQPTERQGDFYPAWSPDGRYIAFARFVGPHIYQLLRVPAQGGEPEVIVETPIEFRALAWRDSQRLLYMIVQDDMPTLWQWQQGHSEKWLTLTDPDMYSLAVSPAGGRAVLVRLHRQRSIWSYDNPRGSSPTIGKPKPLLVSSRQDYDAQFSPDGRQLAFVSTRTGRAALWLADDVGTNPHLLWESPGSQVIGISWSPDSRRLVFERARGATSELCIVTTSGVLNCLMPNAEKNEMPAWSPDGQWIYYTAASENAWSVWRVRVDGTDGNLLVSDSAFAATASRDGKRLLFARVGVDGLWSYTLETGVIACVVPDLPSAHPRAYSEGPDGIYYLNGRDEIVFVPANGAPKTTQFKIDGILRSASLSLHPDASRMVLTLKEADRGDISLIDNLDDVAPP